MNSSNLSRHIKEHLDGKVDPTANMTPEQLQFHYFNLHDLDKNGKLDGTELIKAITHFHAGDFVFCSFHNCYYRYCSGVLFENMLKFL